MEFLVFLIVLLIVCFIFLSVGTAKYKKGINLACSYLGKEVPSDFELEKKDNPWFAKNHPWITKNDNYQKHFADFPQRIIRLRTNAGERKIIGVEIFYLGFNNPKAEAVLFSRELEKQGYVELEKMRKVFTDKEREVSPFKEDALVARAMFNHKDNMMSVSVLTFPNKICVSFRKKKD